MKKVEGEYFCKYSSPVGMMTIASDGENLTGIWFDGQKYFASRLSDNATEKELKVFKLTKAWLNEYFAGREPEQNLPLSFDGLSDFRRKVLSLLLKIPYGQTRTYGQLAKELELLTGKRVSAQAVGGAVGHNPFSIVVPCHRVLGAGGKLTGYAGGIEIKEKLLRHEKNRR